MTLCCATSNPGKLREFQLAAAANRVTIEPLPNFDALPAPVEDGPTFEANAALKALHYSRFTPGALFADDSGLEVDALGGAPGVLSARFAGPDANDLDNNRLLVEKLRGAADRKARFVCVLALAQNGLLLATFRGEVEGLIVDEPRGDNGFGYDPHFFYPPFNCTFGEAPLERKMLVSHRARALRSLLQQEAA